jgi:RNA polymerase sigma factor (sigma-70 family)
MDTIYRRLLTYSYNIVGSYEDAKDLVQDVIEKYIGIDKSGIEHETNYLIKSVINHSINFKNRNNRIAEYGIWLPEPITTETPETKLIREHTASYSLLVLMEQLNAKERAVFILKEGFDYAHNEIAAVLDISCDNSRQLYSRAKRSLHNASFKVKATPASYLNPYIDAIINGDVKALEQLLAHDVRIYADGGNQVKVIKDFVMGRQDSINLLLFVYNTFQHRYQYVSSVVNHEPVICFYRNGRLFNCLIFHCESDIICNIYALVGNQKLKHLDL